MPARYVHVVTVAAVDWGHDYVALGPVEGFQEEVGYTLQSIGALMLTSSDSGRLCDYAVYHSRLHYQMGPFGGQWTYLGTAAQHLGAPHPQPATEQTIQWIHGASYTEAHVHMMCGDHRGESYCTYHVRSSKDQPDTRYALYHLDIWKASDFYRVQGGRYIRDVDLNHWE